MSSYGQLMGFVPIEHRRPKRPNVKALESAPLRKKPAIESLFKKRGPTFTQTKKRKSKKRSSRPSEAGISYFNWSRKPHRLVKKLASKILGNHVNVHQKAKAYRGTLGRQLVCSGFEMAVNSRDDLVAMRDRVAGQAVANDPRTYAWLLKSSQAKYHIKNQSAREVIITIYDIVCKKDISNAGLDIPEEAWKKGIDDDVYTTGVVDKHLLVGQQPRLSSEFRANYRILGQRQVRIPAAGYHEHNVRCKYDRMITSEAIDNMVNAGRSLAGWTYHCMVTACAPAVNDTATQTGAVTYDMALIDVITNVTTRYAWFEYSIPKFNVISELPTTGQFHGAADTNMAAVLSGNNNAG